MGGHPSGRARTLYNKDATQLRRKRHAVLPRWRRHQGAPSPSWWLRREGTHTNVQTERIIYSAHFHLSRVMLVSELR